jgi:enamine deaminase RidA (YjgF/YER057c/UK114 family)
VPPRIVRVPDIPQPLAHYTPAVITGDLVFAAGQIASDYRTGVPPEARVDPAFPYHGSAIKRQARYILDNLARTFTAAGTSLDHCVKAHVFLTDMGQADAFAQVWREFFPGRSPCRATVGMRELLVPGCLVEIDLIATLPSAPARVCGAAAPGADAEAMVAGDLVFASGQRAGGDGIERQTREILGALGRALQAAGSSLDHAVKAHVFLRDLQDFAGLDQVWQEVFASPPPRTAVGTTGLLAPGARVEIDLVAARPGARRDVVPVADIPRPRAAYAPALRAGSLVFAAGALASDWATGVAPEARVDPAFPYYASAIKKQTRYVLDNLARTFAAAGTALDHVVKAQVYLIDLADFHAFDEVWKEYFPVPPPRSTLRTTGLLVPGCRVEIDLIAAMPP